VSFTVALLKNEKTDFILYLKVKQKQLRLFVIYLNPNICRGGRPGCRRVVAGMVHDHLQRSSIRTTPYTKPVLETESPTPSTTAVTSTPTISVGRVIAKAIYDNKLLECYFTRSFYKHILAKPVRHQVRYLKTKSSSNSFLFDAFSRIWRAKITPSSRVSTSCLNTTLKILDPNSTSRHPAFEMTGLYLLFDGKLGLEDVEQAAFPTVLDDGKNNL
jgi:hypothetical protein